MIVLVGIVLVGVALCAYYEHNNRIQTRRREKFYLEMNRHYFPGTKEPLVLPAITDIDSFPELSVAIEQDKQSGKIVLVVYRGLNQQKVQRLVLRTMTPLGSVQKQVRDFASMRGKWVYANSGVACNLWASNRASVEVIEF